MELSQVKICQGGISCRPSSYDNPIEPDKQSQLVLCANSVVLEFVNAMVVQACVERSCDGCCIEGLGADCGVRLSS